MGKMNVARKTQHRQTDGTKRLAQRNHPEQSVRELDPLKSAAEAGPPGDGWEDIGYENLEGFVRIAEGVQVHAKLLRTVVREKYPFLVIELCTPHEVEDREGTKEGKVGDIVGLSYSSCLRSVVERGDGIEFWVEFGAKTQTRSGNECWTLAKRFVRGTGKSVPNPAPRSDTNGDASDDDIPF
jgi:hypothetical protein